MSFEGIPAKTYSLPQVQWRSPPVDQQQRHFLLERKTLFLKLVFNQEQMQLMSVACGGLEQWQQHGLACLGFSPLVACVELNTRTLVLSSCLALQKTKMCKSDH